MEYFARRPSPIPSVISNVISASSKGVSGFSILWGFVASDLYWLYMIFMSHVANPVSVFVLDSQTGLHLRSGQIGSLTVTLAWSELRPAVLLSLIVFVLATLVVDAAGRVLASSGRASSGRLAPV